MYIKGFILAFSFVQNLNGQVSYPQPTAAANNIAIAILDGEVYAYGKTYSITGIVKFQELPNTMRVTVNIYGLPPGRPYDHGMHIHEFGISVTSKSLTARCDSAGDHFNPLYMSHGSLTSSIRHAGDFGNVRSNAYGGITGTFNSPTIRLNGRTGILGRTVILHQNTDDLGTKNNQLSKTVGNSGGRIACGVIGTQNPKFA